MLFGIWWANITAMEGEGGRKKNSLHISVGH